MKHFNIIWSISILFEAFQHNLKHFNIIWSISTVFEAFQHYLSISTLFEAFQHYLKHFNIIWSNPPTPQAPLPRYRSSLVTFRTLPPIVIGVILSWNPSERTKSKTSDLIWWVIFKAQTWSQSESNMTVKEKIAL